MTASTEPTTAALVHAIGQDGLFVLRVRSADVRIHGVEGPDVRVRARDGGPLDDLTVERGERSLSLRAGGAIALVGLGRRGGSGSRDLDVDVPAGASLVVEGASSDITVDDLTGEQRIRTASGDVTVRSARGTIIIEAVSGDVEVTAAGPSAVSVRTVSGDLAIRAGVITSLRATTTSGDLRIAGRFDGPGPFALETVSGDAILAPAGDARVEARTIAGDIRSELSTRIEREAGRRALVIGAGGPTVTFRSASGDLRLVPAASLRRTEATASLAEPTVAPAPSIAAPPASPTPPVEPGPSVPPPTPALVQAYEEARLGVLRALERGDIDIDEARRRLEALDGGEPLDRPAVPAEADHA